jgi:hypothetical protein
MPGAVCWTCYFLLSAGANWPAVNLVEAIAFLAVYPAIACAVVSLLLFIRFRRTAYTWYVAVNLLVNVSGLAFVFSDTLYAIYEYARGVYQFCVQYWL